MSSTRRQFGKSLRGGIAVLALVSLAQGCNRYSFVWAQKLPDAAFVDPPIVIRAGDQITVVVKNQAQLSGAYTVGMAGDYVQPLIGHVKVEGRTTRDVATELTSRLHGLVAEPSVTVGIQTSPAFEVDVLGEVRSPGRFQIPKSEGVLGVLARAGGVTEFANRNAIYVVRTTPERQRVRFRYQDLVAGDPRSHAFRVRAGDVIVVE